MSQARLSSLVAAHVDALTAFFAGQEASILAFAGDVASCLSRGGKILICGNGGSACDAMHIAGEWVGRFQAERRGYPAIALTADGGILTAVGNDYGFEQVFARQVEALGQEGDLLIALSTSGTSPNVVAALQAARARKMQTVLLTGERGAGQKTLADRVFVVPSSVTARVQEVHITLLHAVAELADVSLIGEAAA